VRVRSPSSSYPGRVPTYEYRCRECGSTFEVRRPMTDSAAPAVCADGHPDTVRLLSTVAMSRGATERPAAVSAAGPPRGGCCGGGCGCG
jgi:putative FmdB family regulatory protein